MPKLAKWVATHIFCLKVIVWPFKTNIEMCFSTWGKVVLPIWSSSFSCSCLWHFLAGKHFLLFSSSLRRTCVQRCAINELPVNIHAFCLMRCPHNPCSLLLYAALFSKQVRASTMHLCYILWIVFFFSCGNKPETRTSTQYSNATTWLRLNVLSLLK